MSQQPNVTVLADPAGAVNDAAILGSSTAAPTLVFKPGVVFSNHGPIRQNVYTSPNISGTDGLVLLQETVQGQGFFPTIPLPSSEIEFDFSSNADAFALTANLNLGANATVKGLVNQVNGVVPTLSTGTFTVVAPLEIANLVLIAQATSGQTFTAAPAAITFSGRTTVTNPNGFPLYALSSGTSNVTLKEESALGDGTNPVISTSGGALTLNLYGISSVKAGALTRSGGTVTIKICSSSATVDTSYYGMAGVTIVNLNSQPGQTVIFDPTVPAGGNVYATFAAACKAAKTFPGITTIYCASSQTIPAAAYDPGNKWILEIAPNVVIITLTEGVTFATQPLQIISRDATLGGFLASIATATSPFTGSTMGCTIINMNLSAGTALMFDWSASGRGVIFYGCSFGGTHTIVHAQDVVLGRSPNSIKTSITTVNEPAIQLVNSGSVVCIDETIVLANTIATGALYTFNADISCSIAPAQSGVPGGVLTITWLNSQPLNTIPYTPGNASKWAGGTVASLQAALDRIAAVVGTPTPIP